MNLVSLATKWGKLHNSKEKYTEPIGMIFQGNVIADAINS